MNASALTDHKEDEKAVITRDFGSATMTGLANTIVHEIFHCISYDYNRPGLTGQRYDGNTLQDASSDVAFPAWFTEGTAATVENGWQLRRDLLKLLRTSNSGGTYVEKDGFYRDTVVKDTSTASAVMTKAATSNVITILIFSTPTARTKTDLPAVKYRAAMSADIWPVCTCMSSPPRVPASAVP